MKLNFFKMVQRTFIAGAAVVMLTTACNPEPDDEDLYTFTGETIESYIAQDASLTAFNYILSRVGYDKMMAAYGLYTCFAPTNEGVYAYCDSLYNDEEALIPHNGMTGEGLEGLSDSLCLSIARYHIVDSYRNLVSMTGTGDVLTLLGYEFSYSSNTGETVLAGKATIIESDHDTENGLVHKIDNVIPRSTRFIDNILERDGGFTIFSKALEMTGLKDSLMLINKGRYKFKQESRLNWSGEAWPAAGPGKEGYADYKYGYTLFAESDATFASKGINSIDQLISYANNIYGNCSSWYNYVGEKGITVSTGNDYTNRFNALNMFVAYHILKVSMSANQLVYEKGSSKYWNYAPDADPYDYYETMLPNTLLKIWAPGQSSALYINRYQTFNTLTNELASTGSNHSVQRTGVLIDRTAKLQAYNGYIHPIRDILVYDEMVPRGVLNERMRVNCTSIFPDIINNHYRYMTIDDSPDRASRIGLSNSALTNMVHYDTTKVCVTYVVRGWMRCYEKDQMQFWGKYDLAFRLPSVPSGNYEIRVVYAPMDYGSFMQYYIGTSSAIQDMRPIGLPFDARVHGEDPRIGLTNYYEEDDQGIATDIALRNRGYMRGPYSYFGGTNVTEWSTTNNGRADAGSTIRYILGRVDLKQSNDNWLRIKNLDPETKSETPVGLDFVELVPSSVLDNQQYMEDWY